MGPPIPSKALGMAPRLTSGPDYPAVSKQRTCRLSTFSMYQKPVRRRFCAFVDILGTSPPPDEAAALAGIQQKCDDVSTYYKQASYDQLNVDVDVVGFFKMANKRDRYYKAAPFD